MIPIQRCEYRFGKDPQTRIWRSQWSGGLCLLADKTRDNPSIYRMSPRLLLLRQHNSLRFAKEHFRSLAKARSYCEFLSLAPLPTCIGAARRPCMLDQSSNLLLAALSPKYRASLLLRMKTVLLSPREVLYEPDETPRFAHFMTGGIASIVSSMSTGAATRRGY